MKMFFFLLLSSTWATFFKIKDKNMDRDVLQKHVWMRVDGELQNIHI